MKKLSFVLGVGFVLSVFLPAASFAAGPLLTVEGTPPVWDNSTDILFHPESGNCGPMSNSEVIDEIEDSLSEWEDVITANIEFTIVEGQLGNVGINNYDEFLILDASVQTASQQNAILNDGLNPLIFDETGDIIAAYAGEENRLAVIGLAAPVGFSNDFTEILKGQAILNCLCLEGDVSSACEGLSIPLSMFRTLVVHEMGHFLNLDHTQVNTDLLGSDGSGSDNLPTMYPILSLSALQKTVHEDDKVSLSQLYPSSQLDDQYCTVRGTLLDINDDPLPCADVQASTGNASETVSSITGAHALLIDDNEDGDFFDDGECPASGGCGSFELYLKAGESYTLNIESINSFFVGGSSVGPCFNGQNSGVVSESDVRTISSSQCVAGSTVNLGNISTTSTGGVTQTSSDDGDSILDDVSLGCSLHSTPASRSLGMSGFMGLILVSVMFILRQQSKASR